MVPPRCHFAKVRCRSRSLFAPARLPGIDAGRLVIIKRRRNASFTTLGNDPIDDERLSPDALGVLTYLLSKPDDWEVRPSQLRRRFSRVGRDKMQRILGELIDAGYMLRRKARNPLTGAFERDKFLVFDEPQNADEVGLERVEPAPEKAAVGYPAPANPSLAIYKDLPKTELEPKTDSEDIPPAPAIGTPLAELQAVLSSQQAEAVLEHRLRLRKPLTTYAARLLAAKFARTADPNAAADAMIANGWQGFDPAWLEHRRGPPAASSHMRPSSTQTAFDVLEGFKTGSPVDRSTDRGFAASSPTRERRRSD